MADKQIAKESVVSGDTFYTEFKDALNYIGLGFHQAHLMEVMFVPTEGGMAVRFTNTHDPSRMSIFRIPSI